MKKYKYFEIFVVVLLFLFVFVITGFHQANPDIYIHLTAGNVIAHYGIIHYDVLSQLGSGQQWLPMEWLFQVILYWFISLFGFFSYKIFIGIFGVLQVFALYILLRRGLNLNILSAVSASAFYTLATYPFLVARPQLISSIFFITELYILILYVVRDKNYLYLLLPITYLWANLHASIILNIFLFIAYIFVCILNFYKSKSKNIDWLRKAKTLGLYVVAVFLVSVLPPQGFMQFKVLSQFVKYRELVVHSISEWAPLWNYSVPFEIYFASAVIVVFAFIFIILRKKLFSNSFCTFPVLIFIPYGFLAIRNMYYGFLAMSILLAYTISQINFRQVGKFVKIIFAALFVIALIVLANWAIQDDLNNKQEFPEQAANFVKKEDIQGQTFNQFGYGSFLEYRLYPPRKAFIDEKDFFVTIPDYYYLQSSISLSPNYRDLFISYLNKHNISNVILVVKNDTSGQIWSRILMDSPNWTLVFWDDVSEIFIKNDGQNRNILENFSAKAVDPFGETPYKIGSEKQALDEYQRMNKTQDSALSHTAIGYLLEKEEKLSEAGEEFEKALQLNKYHLPAIINLGLLKAKQGKFQQAIDLFRKALKVNSAQMEIYVYLADLYGAIGDSQSRSEILNQAISRSTDENQIQFFRQKLQPSSK